METAAIEAFIELVTKLNEATFKPFFRRLFDWAFSSSKDESSSCKPATDRLVNVAGNESRQITFSIAMTALLDMFKVRIHRASAYLILISNKQNLIVPYMSMTLESVTETLQRFISGQCKNHILWIALIRMLQSSLNVDEGRKYKLSVQLLSALTWRQCFGEMIVWSASRKLSQNRSRPVLGCELTTANHCFPRAWLPLHIPSIEKNCSSRSISTF